MTGESGEAHTTSLVATTLVKQRVLHPRSQCARHVFVRRVRLLHEHTQGGGADLGAHVNQLLEAGHALGDYMGKYTRGVEGVQGLKREVCVSYMYMSNLS